MSLSVVIPVYDEEENVGLLHPRIEEACAPLQIPFEIIFIDDRSKDRTWERLNELEAGAGELVVARLMRNAGQTPAMAAGLELSRGDIVVTMDGDLQNDPSDIPALMEKMRENGGFDMVCGWRKKRQDKLWSRKIPSKCANWLIRKLTRVTISDYGCSLKAYTRELVDRMRLYSDMHRFLPFISQQVGARYTELAVKHHARIHGVTKYGLSRIWKVLVDLFALKVLVHYYRRLFLCFILMALPLFAVFGVLLYGSFQAPFETRQTVIGATVVVGTAAVFTCILGLVSDMVLKSNWKEFDRLLVIDDRTGDTLA